MLRFLSQAPKGDSPIFALTLLGFAVVILAVQDAFIKTQSHHLTFWQIQMLRSCCNMSFLAIFAYLSGGLMQLRPKRLGYVALRGGILACTMVLLFGAAPSLNFSQMASGLYSYPLFMTIFASIFLRESIGIWRLSALMIGVFGAFILLNPLAEDFTVHQLFPVCAGLFYALNVMVVRSGCREESPLAISFMTALVFLLSGITGVGLLHIITVPLDWQTSLPFVTIPWRPLSLWLLGVIVSMSLLNVLGNLLNVRAYQTAESSILAPLDFSYLLFAALLGWLLFSEELAGRDILGMSLIAMAGIVITIRQHYRKV